MDKKESLLWFSGLFEGEGSFSFYKEKARKITLTSTDRDVLERIVENFGGVIIKPKKRKEHWKQEYVWYIDKHQAYIIVIQMLPYLCERRSKRGNEWIESYLKETKILKEKEEIRKNSRILIKELREKGLTHVEISNIVGYERSHVSKILKNF